MASMLNLFASDQQNKIIRNAERTGDVKTRTGL
jgi:hypothetical protein